jgi:hypothetical protein
MIDYRAFIESVGYTQTKDVDYLLGVPSGQIIDIDYGDINNLKQEGLISYSQKYVSYIFNDEDYDIILSRLNKGNNKNTTDNIIINFFQKQKHYKKYTISYIKGYYNVDVIGSIYVDGEDYKKFPFNFKNISGDFIFKNSKLTTLEGGPKIVKGNFDVSGNDLIDLIGGPISVGKTYDCSNNMLMSLRGSPPLIGQDFDCSNNNLTDLSKGPVDVAGFFDCTGNNLKKDLDYQPKCFKLIRFGKPISDFTKKNMKDGNE